MTDLVHTSGKAVITFYSCTVDTAQVTISEEKGTKVNGINAQLTPNENLVLLRIAQSGGYVCTKHMILSSRYASGKVAEYKIIDVLICRIRRKLQEIHTRAGDVLRTVGGRGYAFGIPPTQPVPASVDLPNPARWHTYSKQKLLETVSEGQVTIDEVLRHYVDLSREEFEEWKQLYKLHGGKGLSISKADTYSLMAA